MPMDVGLQYSGYNVASCERHTRNNQNKTNSLFHEDKEVYNSPGSTIPYVTKSHTMTTSDVNQDISATTINTQVTCKGNGSSGDFRGSKLTTTECTSKIMHIQRNEASDSGQEPVNSFKQSQSSSLWKSKGSQCIQSYTTRYEIGRVLGNGSFGLVSEARQCDTGEIVAIKKVLQDPHYKNRELSVMKELSHPNIVVLKDYFYTEYMVSTSDNNVEESTEPNASASKSSTKMHRYLNVVMEHVPDTVYRVMKSYIRHSNCLPLILVRLYIYQLCRSLGYLHGLGYCHRDIKPHNLLVDPKTHVLKLCDFGSAKRLSPAEPSVAYICSRFYRAPELMLGTTEYTTAIDIWSVGCVLGEFLIGKPLFPGDSSVDQLVKIIQVLGTPTHQQMRAMNPGYSVFQFPYVRPKDWASFLMSVSTPNNNNVCSEATDLLSSFLKYDPDERLDPYEALTHSFFDPLYDPSTRLPDGSCLPDLFHFTEDELSFIPPTLKARTTSLSTFPSLNMQRYQLPTKLMSTTEYYAFDQHPHAVFCR